MQRIQRQAVLYLELLGGAAGVRSDRPALRRLDRDDAMDAVNFGQRARARLLGQGRRADDGEGRSASQHDPRDFHGRLPVLGTCPTSRDGRIGSRGGIREGLANSFAWRPAARSPPGASRHHATGWMAPVEIVSTGSEIRRQTCARPPSPAIDSFLLKLQQ